MEAGKGGASSSWAKRTPSEMRKEMGGAKGRNGEGKGAMEGVGSVQSFPASLLFPSDVAQVEIGLLYPPVGWDLLRLVALHVLLHGGKAGAVFQADGALVRRGSVVGPEMLDHGGVISRPLVAEFALKGLLACGVGEGGSGRGGGKRRGEEGEGEDRKGEAGRREERGEEERRGEEREGEEGKGERKEKKEKEK